jgi:hypothetical protein
MHKFTFKTTRPTGSYSSLMKNILIILLLFILTSCLETPAMRREREYVTRIKQLERELKQMKADTSVQMVSPVVVIKPNYKNMPSYCDPKKYSIAQIGGKYRVRLPHGTIGDVSYDTPQQAQKEINRSASISLQRWIETGGNNF